MSKTILITGASTGIGKATAQFFVEQGWNVVATMRDPEKTGLKDARIISLRLDVTDPQTITRAIDETIAKFGAIDVVVNNAGYGLVGPFENATLEQIRRQYDTNVFGVMHVTRAILPHFRKRRAGIIMNVASMGGRVTFPLYSLYHGTKWAVEGFSESLQHELREFGIKVKIIEPGAIKTEFYHGSMDLALAEAAGAGSEVGAAYKDMVTRAMPALDGSGETGSDPRLIARLMYRAATDGSWKLRYSAGRNARLLLVLRRLLPDFLFNGIVRRSVMGR